VAHPYLNIRKKALSHAPFRTVLPGRVFSSFLLSLKKTNPSNALSRKSPFVGLGYGYASCDGYCRRTLILLY
jgi:hypothetical protein